MSSHGYFQLDLSNSLTVTRNTNKKEQLKTSKPSNLIKWTMQLSEPFREAFSVEKQGIVSTVPFTISLRFNDWTPRAGYSKGNLS